MKPHEVDKNSDYNKLDSEVDVPTIFLLAVLQKAFGERVSKGIFAHERTNPNLENKLQIEDSSF